MVVFPSIMGRGRNGAIGVYFGDRIDRPDRKKEIKDGSRVSVLNNSFTGKRKSDRKTGWRIQGCKTTQEMPIQLSNAEQGRNMGKNEN